MKAYFFLLIGSYGLFGFAQARPDTIYCNAFQNVVITTPSPIIQAATGSENFVFSYNKAKPDSLGLLQGRPGHTGNLILRTSEGGVYTFLLEHSDSLERHTYFLKRTDRVNPYHSENNKVKNRIKSLGDTKKSLEHYRKLARFYMHKNTNRMAVGRSQGLILELMDIKYTKDETFVVYRIENRSEIAFTLAHMELNRILGKPGRKSSYQALSLKPIFTYNLPDTLLAKRKQRFVVAYRRFTLSAAAKLRAVLSEKQGSRQVSLEYH